VSSNLQLQVEQAIENAQEAAYDLGPSLADVQLRTRILAATIQLRTLLADPENNPECTSVVTSDSPVACWSSSCLEWGRADAPWWNDWRYSLNCSDWEAAVRNWLAELADLTAQIDPGLSEVFESLTDQTATIGEQSELVVPDPAQVLDTTPTWLKLAGLGVVALLVVRVAK
jgi:hypothetical protein